MEKIAVITGATSGLGKELKKLYESDGYRVCVLARSCDNEELDEYKCDVSDEAQVNLAAAKIAAKYGRIDVVVNNAGMGVLGPTELIPAEDIRRAFDVSYYGALNVSRACLKYMLRGGRIIFICSIAAFTAVPYRSPYSSAKAAELMLGMSMRMELKKAGITVTCVCPGEIRTEFSANRAVAAETSDRYGDRPQAALDRIKRKTPERMPVEKAAKKIYRICRKGKRAVYVIGGKYRLFRLAQRFTGDTFFLNMTDKFS